MFSTGELAATLLRLPAILFAISIHECAHAFIAARLGDRTSEGRLTLNPLAHLDPMGFICLLFLGFGWAKPVTVNPRAFQKPRRDEILVSVAGPASNVVAAIFFGWMLKMMLVFGRQWFSQPVWGEALFVMMVNFVLINIGLAVFNMFPIPPLDGSHVIAVLIPDKYFYVKVALFRYGTMALIGLILLETVTNRDILPIGQIIAFLAGWIFKLLGLRIVL